MSPRDPAAVGSPDAAPLAPRPLAPSDPDRVGGADDREQSAAAENAPEAKPSAPGEPSAPRP